MSTIATAESRRTRPASRLSQRFSHNPGLVQYCPPNIIPCVNVALRRPRHPGCPSRCPRPMLACTLLKRPHEIAARRTTQLVAPVVPALVPPACGPVAPLGGCRRRRSAAAPTIRLVAPIVPALVALRADRLSGDGPQTAARDVDHPSRCPTRSRCPFPGLPTRRPSAPLGGGRTRRPETPTTVRLGGAMRLPSRAMERHTWGECHASDRPPATLHRKLKSPAQSRSNGPAREPGWSRGSPTHV